MRNVEHIHAGHIQAGHIQAGHARIGHVETGHAGTGAAAPDPPAPDPAAGSEPEERFRRAVWCPLLAGAAAGTAGLGAWLAAAGLASPVRAPFTLFFLLCVPAVAVTAHLRGRDPLCRAVAATATSVVLNLAAAQALLLLRLWSVRGLTVTVTVLGAALFALAAARPAVRPVLRAVSRAPRPPAAPPQLLRPAPRGKKSAR